MKILNIVFIAMLFAFFGCSLDAPTEKETVLSTGDADFTRYVAIGNSLTAGYQSGALTQSHQIYSYPNQIATQAGVKSFTQPLLGYPGIGAFSADTVNPAGIMELTYLDNPATPNTVNPDPVITPEPFADHADTFNPLFPYVSADVASNNSLPYNNLGIPGSVLGHMLATYSAATSGTGNSFFDIILRNPNFGNTTVYQQAKMLQPTFLTCWIGNNDVLGYATSGGTSPAAPTDVATFTILYGQLLDSLLTTGADIVVANIPDVTAIPFFTTIPGVLLNTETNEPLIIDGNVVPIIGVNPATDFVLLSAPEALKLGLGVPTSLGGTGAPLPDQFILDASEIAIASQAVSDFNAAIKNLADARGIAVVDINSFFNDIKANGYTLAGVEFTPKFLTGGIFSLDGVHPSDVGYGIVTNEFIKTINSKFSASIPMVNIVDLMTEISPSVNLAKVSYKKNAFKNMVTMFSGK